MARVNDTSQKSNARRVALLVIGLIGLPHAGQAEATCDFEHHCYEDQPRRRSSAIIWTPRIPILRPRRRRPSILKPPARGAASPFSPCFGCDPFRTSSR